MTMEENEIQKGPVRRRINALITVFLILAVLVCLFVMVQVLSKGYANIAGFSLFRVVTGSMEPEIPVGSLLVCKQVEMDQVQLRDVICFRAQDSAIFGKMMTHRVVDILNGADGSILFETRGDANLASDGYLVTQTNFVGKVIWYTGANSMLSEVFSFFTNKVGFLACIVFPCLLLAGLILKDSVKNIKNELQNALEDLERKPEQEETLLELTEQERSEMYERIRAELLEELKQSAENTKAE